MLFKQPAVSYYIVLALLIFVNTAVNTFRKNLSSLKKRVLCCEMAWSNN